MKSTTSSKTNNTMTASSTTPGNSASALFCEQVNTVTNLFEKWNDCERIVVMYALLKRLRYAGLKFLQYSIDAGLAQRLCSQSNMNALIFEMNANNPSYLQNLFNTYKTFQQNTMEDALSCATTYDKDSCYRSDFQITHCGGRKLYSKKEDILEELLNLLPLLKPGNEESKLIYLTLIPCAVKDTIQQIVSTDLVQQIFSYLLIHPAISSDDRKSLNVWLRHLEDHIQFFQGDRGKLGQQSLLLETPYCGGNPSMSSAALSAAARNADWQTIAPPSKQHYLLKSDNKLLMDNANKSNAVGGSTIVDKLCDNIKGITAKELAASQNSLGLSIGIAPLDLQQHSSTLVNGVVAAASIATVPNFFAAPTNTIINILNNNTCSNNLNDDHDTSFSKNGTEIFDFEPNSNLNSCDSCSHSPGQHKSNYGNILMNNYDTLDINQWGIDRKLASLKTRRSNSLTTQTISSSSSSPNSSVITVNDNCSNSTENLAQFSNKPRSFSLSFEHQRDTLGNSGSDPRLTDIKPNYIRFQSRNTGMSNIGLWLKSLRLHKYIELFKNMTYEEMLEIKEEYLQNLGVTKGASHKLAICIEKLKERSHLLAKIEQDLLNGETNVQIALEELSNIVLTPMKPFDVVNTNSRDENVASQFLRVVDLVCSVFQKNLCSDQDEESISMIVWILDRSIHNDAFTNHVNQLKDLKFKISKKKISVFPKLNLPKNCNAGSLNKSRWNGKTRKNDANNGSSDRIAHRKNSGDLLNFSLTYLQQNNHNSHKQQNEYEKYKQFVTESSQNNNQYPHKSSSYPNFINNHQTQNQQMWHKHQQQQIQLQMLQHNTHFPALPPPHQPIRQKNIQVQQHRRSLNNIILPGGMQQQQDITATDKMRAGNAAKSELRGSSSVAKSSENTKAATVLISNNEMSTANNNGSNAVKGQIIGRQQPFQTVSTVDSISSNSCAGAGVMMQSCVCSINTRRDSNCCNCNSFKLICDPTLIDTIAEPAKENIQLAENYAGANDISSLEQLETLCIRMTEQAIN